MVSATFSWPVGWTGSILLCCAAVSNELYGSDFCRWACVGKGATPVFVAASDRESTLEQLNKHRNPSENSSHWARRHAQVSQDPSNKSICCFFLRISVEKVIKLCPGTPHSITLIKNLYKIPNEPVPGDDPQWLTMTSSSSPVSASLGTFPAAPQCHLESSLWFWALNVPSDYQVHQGNKVYTKVIHLLKDAQHLSTIEILTFAFIKLSNKHHPIKSSIIAFPVISRELRFPGAWLMYNGNLWKQKRWESVTFFYGLSILVRCNEHKSVSSAK